MFVYTTFGTGVSNITNITFPDDPYKTYQRSGDFAVSGASVNPTTGRGRVPLTGTLVFTRGTSLGDQRAELTSLVLDLADPARPTVTGILRTDNVNVPAGSRVTLLVGAAAVSVRSTPSSLGLGPVDLRVTPTAASLLATVFPVTAPPFNAGDDFGTITVALS